MPSYQIHPDGRRLGRTPRREDPRRLQLARYVDFARLPAPPAVVDHYSALETVAAWGMLGNNAEGDCGPAGAAHQVMAWTAVAGAVVIPTTLQVLNDYHAITGGPDIGVNLLDMNNYWRSHGIVGDKIEAYAEVHLGDPAADEAVVHYFGNEGLGLSLPDRNTFGPWTSHTPLQDYGSPDRSQGHYIILVGFNRAERMFDGVTWGERVKVSYEFVTAYTDEKYAYLDDASISRATGLSPEGFNFTTLQDDLAHINDPVTPPDGPPPPPPPSPDPGPGCLGSLSFIPLWLSGLR